MKESSTRKSDSVKFRVGDRKYRAKNGNLFHSKRKFGQNAVLIYKDRGTTGMKSDLVIAPIDSDGHTIVDANRHYGVYTPEVDIVSAHSCERTHGASLAKNVFIRWVAQERREQQAENCTVELSPPPVEGDVQVTVDCNRADPFQKSGVEASVSVSPGSQTNRCDETSSEVIQSKNRKVSGAEAASPYVSLIGQLWATANSAEFASAACVWSTFGKEVKTTLIVAELLNLMASSNSEGYL